MIQHRFDNGVGFQGIACIEDCTAEVDGSLFGMEYSIKVDLPGVYETTENEYIEKKAWELASDVYEEDGFGTIEEAIRNWAY